MPQLSDRLLYLWDVRKQTRFFVVAVVIAISVAACDSRPLPPEFAQSTTSSTTIIASGSPQSSTTITLPPVDDRVVGTVVSVIDGDTLSMLIDGAPTDVRLSGINAPELTECWGQQAQDRLAALVGDSELLLVAGNSEVDEFGRLLRYAYLESSEATVFINSTLVSEGNAVAVHNGEDFDTAFKSLEARAFQSGRGMWGGVVCGNGEAIRADRPVVRIDDIVFDPPGPDDEALDDEYVTIVNEGYGRVDISGWTLRDESSTNRITIPGGAVLSPGDTFTVVTGCDDSGSNTIAWCSDTPIWSNGGDTVIVSDTLGNAMIWFTYRGDSG
jgi:endonuclease YncB( thermonuclease family)